MAENWTRAFGRYLRTLRERRGLSLHDVSSLSQAFAETLNKGYLSRCENGHQRLALSKVIPLSRIYDISADVLLERIELDMELDRVGSPDTAGLDFSEMTKAGTKALNQGYRWDAYAYLRDATTHAASDAKMSGFRDIDEQVVCSHMTCGTAAMALGRIQFALHEYLFAKQTDLVGPRFSSILLERLSQTYRQMGQNDTARQFAEEAIEQAERFGEIDYLGYVYSNRASQAFADSDLELAAVFWQKAYRTYREANRLYECSSSLHNLAQVYFDLGRYRAARRSLIAGARVLRPLAQHRAEALNHILMGEIDALEKKASSATAHWKSAASIAKKLDDKILRFKAEYLLFKEAYSSGNQPVARSIRRRLRRLAQWVPKNTPELRDFEELTSKVTT